LPFLCIHAGPKSETRDDGSIRFVTLKRSPLSIPLDHSLRYDPFFQRHIKKVRQAMIDFKPDVVHITGPNDVSIMGAWMAWKLDIALVGSWHTNIHEYAARRLRKSLWFMPQKVSWEFTKFIERQIRTGAKFYYTMPQVLLAPNQELVEMLQTGTPRPSKLMVRGVDTEIFSPAKRTVTDGLIRFGFVGRLRAEKNVRMLVDLEKKLLEAGYDNFRFLIVGEGDERKYLAANMKTADFTGFLEGERLSEAYANMDVFVFPSDTDAFGNVPQEAMASGAPSIVSDKGGPKFFVENGMNGFVAADLDGFVKYAKQLLDEPELLERMKVSSREFAKTRTWESVFETVYQAYAEAKERLDTLRADQPNRRKRVLSLLRRSPVARH
jgi:glycosyltransferase involved in cell wall biosynthesis